MQGNRLLSFLLNARPEFVRYRIKPVNFARGERFFEPGAAITRVVFPDSGLISLTVQLTSGNRIEVSLIGSDGALGTEVVFGDENHLNSGCAQLPVTGWSMAPRDLIELSQEHREVETQLFRHERFLLAQAQQIVACNTAHTLRQRLCTWLLRAQDVTGSAELSLTQEFIAEMLGVRRPGVSPVTQQLRRDGIIRQRRGGIVILDKAALAREACECYLAIRRFRAHYLGGNPLPTRAIV
jgi:CRP-like cAMP-binding protein